MYFVFCKLANVANLSLTFFSLPPHQVIGMIQSPAPGPVLVLELTASMTPTLMDHWTGEYHLPQLILNQSPSLLSPVHKK